jgi:hypothetical protein
VARAGIDGAAISSTNSTRFATAVSVFFLRRPVTLRRGSLFDHVARRM